MPLPSFLQIGLSSLLDSPAVVELAARASDKAVAALKNHFTLSSKEITEAFQKSYVYALVAISAGLSTPEQKLKFWQKLTHSKLEREFSDQIEINYLRPFAAEFGVQSEALPRFRAEAIKTCKALAKYTQHLFQTPSELTEADLTAIISYKGTFAITDLVLKQLQTQTPPVLEKPGLSLTDDFIAFLRYKELLGNAILFFFLEQLRKHSRVKDTYAALQRAGVWVDVRDLKTAQTKLTATVEQQTAAIQRQLDEQKTQMLEAMQANDFAQTGEINQQLQQLQQQADAAQNQLATLPQRLEKAHAAWQTSYAQLSQFTAAFQTWLPLLTEKIDVVVAGLDELMPIVKGMDDKLDKILQKMALMGLSQQVKPRDEFTQYDNTQLKYLADDIAEIKHLLTAHPHCQVALIEGSLYSSQGDLAQAEQNFLQAREIASNDNERALACFNLFQVRLRRKAYPKALTALQEAYTLNTWQYALHDVNKYPIQRILGAGGMGCVFLCHDQWSEDQVVIKCFWEGRKGLQQDVFAEAIIMRQLASAYTPKPLDYDYVDVINQERPYFITEYIDGAIDGEIWITEQGKLDVLTGLQVGWQVAQGLAIAHQAGIYHLDLKPANLLFKPLQDGLAVKIIDFGLARVATSLKQQAALTQTRSNKSVFAQAVIGTLDYAPPEQLGETEKYGQPSAKSDVYAFGATLYHLFSGDSPRFYDPDELPKLPALRTLLLACLKNPPQKRPDINTVAMRFSDLLDKLDNKRIEQRQQAEQAKQKATEQQRAKEQLKQTELARQKAETEQLKQVKEQLKQAEIAKQQAEEQFKQAKARQQTEEQRRKQAELATKKAEEQLAAFAMKQQAEEQRQQAELAKQKAAEENKGKLFEFEVVTVNANGGISNRNRTRKQAHVQTTDLGNGVILETVYIPGGTFQMGSPETEKGRYDNESPQHRVTVEPFYMGKYPVTQVQWQAVMGDNPSEFKGKNRPVESVSYDDVVKFCQRLSEKTGQDYLLPSEAEWEYACRAGTTTPFYFGETITTDLANYDGNSTYALGPKGVYRQETTEVGSFPPNAFGLYDMHGNVWEWCADPWHDSYQGAPTDGRVWEADADGSLRALRGGAFHPLPWSVRTADRDRNSPDYRDDGVGFRLARRYP